MSNISKRRREGANYAFKVMGDNDEFLNRITKSLYYGKLPKTERLSMPMSELAAELFSEKHRGHTLQRLHVGDAAEMSTNACVSPCALVLAMLYLDRLKDCDPDYVRKVAPSELFLVSLMVSSKFLHDDGAEDEVFLDEWATSGNITTQKLIELEKEFLNAIEWKIFTSQATFWTQLSCLEQTLAWRQGTKRGWFSYRELALLLPSIELAKILICTTGILALGYTAGVLSLIGAVFLTSHLPGTALKSTHLQTDSTVINPDQKNTYIVDQTDKTLSSQIQITDFDLDYLQFDLNENITLYNEVDSNASDLLSYWLQVSPISELVQNQNFYLNHVPIWSKLVF